MLRSTNEVGEVELKNADLLSAGKNKNNDWKKAEELYAEALKESMTKGNQQEQFLLFQAIGDTYLERLSEYQDAINLSEYDLSICAIRAMALYQYTLAVGENQDIDHNNIAALQKKIQQVESIYLQIINALNQQPTPSEAIDFYQEILENLRQSVSEQLYNNVATEDICKYVANTYKDLIRFIFTRCLDIVGKKDYPYALIGLGSLARSEVTPYSDVEYALLISDETTEIKSYFRKVATLFQLIVLRLKETPIRMLAIESLEWLYNNHKTATRKGFTCDGYKPKGCKTPLGWGGGEQQEGFELIHTPEIMANFQICASESLQYDKHLPSSLYNWTFVCGHKKLANEYKQKLTQLFIQPSNQFLMQQRALKLLGRDLEEFKPKVYDNSQTENIHIFKFDLYRLFNTVIDNLAIYFQLDTSSTSSEKINILKSKGILNPRVAQDLNRALNEINRLRLEVYQYHTSQNEEIDIYMEDDATVAQFGIPLMQNLDNVSSILEFYVKGNNDARTRRKPFRVTFERLYMIYEILLPFYEMLKTQYNTHPGKINLSTNEYEFEEVDRILMRGLVAKRLGLYKLAQQTLELGVAKSEYPLKESRKMLSLLRLEYLAQLGLVYLAQNLKSATKFLGEVLYRISFYPDIQADLKCMRLVDNVIINYCAAYKLSYGIALEVQENTQSIVVDGLCISQSMIVNQEVPTAVFESVNHINLDKDLPREITNHYIIKQLILLSAMIKDSKISAKNSNNKREYPPASEVLNEVDTLLRGEEKSDTDNNSNFEHDQEVSRGDNSQEDVFQSHYWLVALQEGLITEDQAKGFYHSGSSKGPFDNLAILLSNNGLKALRKKLITPEQAAYIADLNSLLSANGIIALEEKLITPEQARDIYHSGSSEGPFDNLAPLLSDHGLKALRKKLITPGQAAYIDDLASLLTAHGLIALEEKLITSEQARGIYHSGSCEGPFDNLALLLSDHGLKALRKKLITPEQAAYIADLSSLLSSNGIIALEEKLITPEQARGIYHSGSSEGPFDNLALLLSDHGLKALRKKRITPEQAAYEEDLGSLLSAAVEVEEKLAVSEQKQQDIYQSTYPQTSELLYLLCLPEVINSLRQQDFAKARMFFEKRNFNLYNPQIHLELAEFYAKQQNLLGMICHSEFALQLIHRNRIAVNDNGLSRLCHNVACCYHCYAIEQRTQGNVQISQEALDKAKQYFLLGISLSSHISIQTEYAKFLLQEGQVSAAIIQLEQVLRVNQQVKEYLAFADENKIEEDVDGVDLGYSEIERLSLDATLQGELDFWQEILIKPITLAYYLLITAYMQQSNGVLAQQLVVKFKLLAEHENDALTYSLLGHAQQRVDDYLGAIQSYQKALSIKSDYQFALEQQTRCAQILRVSSSSQATNSLSVSQLTLSSVFKSQWRQLDKLPDEGALLAKWRYMKPS